jgi:hypothetical protein
MGQILGTNFEAAGFRQVEDLAEAMVASRDRKFADSLPEEDGFDTSSTRARSIWLSPLYAGDCSGRVGAPSQFSDSMTPCIRPTRRPPPAIAPPRPGQLLP